MARKPSPWWWEGEQGWYVNLNGQRRPLGKHPPGAPAPKKSGRTKQWNVPQEIRDAFHKLMSGDNPRVHDGEAVVVVLDDFLTWCKQQRAGRTAARYGDFIQDFVKARDKGLRFGELNVHQLTDKHVTHWLAQRPTWGLTTQRNAITALFFVQAGERG